ncbi:MAG: hypothetical protein K1X63_06915 [Chitinophagales bacterium]|nr:hypothetical protein [Bacteroidota bacterium]MBX7140797.1 hypothetical protein [Chitinophagales bacterium]
MRRKNFGRLQIGFTFESTKFLTMATKKKAAKKAAKKGAKKAAKKRK